MHKFIIFPTFLLHCLILKKKSAIGVCGKIASPRDTQFTHDESSDKK